MNTPNISERMRRDWWPLRCSQCNRRVCRVDAGPRNVDALKGDEERMRESWKEGADDSCKSRARLPPCEFRRKNVISVLNHDTWGELDVWYKNRKESTSKLQV